MQDKYAGDVGDFGKLALFKALSAPGDIPGVVWYRVANGGTGADGRHVSYLDHPRCGPFEGLDDSLLHGLRNVAAGERSIAALERHVPHLKDAHCFRDPVPRGRSSRNRSDWLHAALKAVDGCSVVLLDPDNGVEPNRPSHKHALWNEIEAFARQTAVLVVYHHMNRNSPHEVQARRTLVEFAARAHFDRRAFALRFRRGTSRVFLVGAKTDREFSRVKAEALKFLESGWIARQHFTPLIELGS